MCFVGPWGENLGFFRRSMAATDRNSGHFVQVKRGGWGPSLEPQGQLFINGCFNWMMNQIFMEKMIVSPFPSIYQWLALGFQVPIKQPV